YMEILGNTWRYLEIHGDTWKYMEILGNTWRYMEMRRNAVEIRMEMSRQFSQRSSFIPSFLHSFVP
ncbi:MAG: hypothetical protein KDD10_09590, partial [Phaeodactylibacter sp.]|nr:hypothetical protein [Phaeodactylibacter sp.]